MRRAIHPSTQSVARPREKTTIPAILVPSRYDQLDEERDQKDAAERDEVREGEDRRRTSAPGSERWLSPSSVGPAGFEPATF